MHRLLLKLVLGAFMSAGALFTVSCADYDDEITRIKQELAIIESSVTQLITKVNSGKWVTSVSPTTDGYSITLSDANGSTETIKLYNGKDGVDGTNGQDGTLGTIVTMNKETGTWFIDGKDTGISYKGEKGDQGESGKDGEAGKDGVDGKSPYVNEDGILIFWDAGNGRWVESAIRVGKDAPLMIDRGSYWLYRFSYQAEDGSYKQDGELKLPKTASILNITAYAYTPEVLKADGSVKDAAVLSEPTFKFQVAAVKLETEDEAGVEFHGVKYAEGNYITKGTNQLLLQVNPSNVDFSLYKESVRLVNSKGESSQVKMNAFELDHTVGAYTRAEATPNNGFYRATLSLPEGIKEIEKAAYAVEVYDAVNDNYVRTSQNITFEKIGTGISELSDYASKTAASFKAEIGTTYKLDELLLISSETFGEYFNLVDYYFDAPQNQNANIDYYEIDFDEANQTIKAGKAGTITLRFNYLAFDGTKEEKRANTSSYTYKTVTIVFDSETTVGTYDYTWIIGYNDTRNDISYSAAKAYEYYSKLENVAILPVDYQFYTLASTITPVYKYIQDVYVNDVKVIKKTSGVYPAVPATLVNQLELVPFTAVDADGYTKYYVAVEFIAPNIADYYATTYNGTLETSTTNPNTGATETLKRTFTVALSLPAVDVNNVIKFAQGVWKDGKATLYPAAPATDNYITADIAPLFVDLNNTNYYVTEYSPCYNANTTANPIWIYPEPWVGGKTPITAPSTGTVIGYNGKQAVSTIVNQNILTVTVPKAGYYSDGTGFTAFTDTYNYIQEGIGTERTFTMHYEVFANEDQFGTLSKDFTLAVRSSYYDGSFDYVKVTRTVHSTTGVTSYTYAAGETKQIVGTTPVSLKLEEIYATDVNTNVLLSAELIDKNVTLGISDVTVEVPEDYQSAIKVNGDNSAILTAVQDIEITRTNGMASIVAPVNCQVKVSYTDAWGMSKSFNVDVVLQPNN